jgi:radical SAM/Cys-rich protein
MPTLTLVRDGNPLADPAEQLRALARACPRPFEAALAGDAPLRAGSLSVLQVNVGKLCNQTCRHCHVDAGPDRREVMDRSTLDHVLRVLRDGRVPVLDVTGGAPEMNPHFRGLVAEARALGTHVIDRCNLTILLAPGYTDLPEFLASHRIEIVASLPCYLESNCDRQRGDGTFRKSIEAIRRLNAVGYGTGSGLTLTLVYNPVGAGLPPPQAKLEADYRAWLKADHGVAFDRLFTITNMPISRFLDDLLRAGRLDEYMHKLVAAYNPAAVTGLMCHNTLSVGWDGRLYDCDFNQMLDLGLATGYPRHIADLDVAALAGRPVVTAPHCYGCTAGSGSGCGGAIVR